ncbi:hypothetical protein CFP59_04855 [Streptomyces malaysiensis subsp. malaysiensis]|nr:hypothetical protein CFP59_04855 [Streptomyces sp. M56]
MTEGGVSGVETELFLLAFTLLGGFLALYRPTAPED